MIVDFFDILLIVISVIAFVNSLGSIREYLILRKEEKMEQEVSQYLGTANDTFVVAKVEVHQGNVYFFDQNTDKFLAQGTSFEEAVDHFAQIFPNKTLLMDQTEFDSYVKH